MTQFYAERPAGRHRRAVSDHAWSSLCNPPNLISLARLALVPVAIVLIGQERWTLAFAIFLVAGASDAIDGFLAKHFDLRTELGAYLDPLADKALLVSIYVALALAVIVPPALTFLVVGRDVLIVLMIGLAVLARRPPDIRPLFVSKLNTAAQIAVAALVLAAKALSWPMGLWFEGAVGAVAVLTTASGFAYLAAWFDHMRSTRASS